MPSADNAVSAPVADAPVSLTSLAAPLYPSARQFHDSVVAEYAKGYLSLFLERFADQIAPASDGLVPFLEQGLAADLGFETVWDSTFMNLRRLCLLPAPPSREVIHAAAAVGLQLLCGGVGGDFQAGLDPVSPLRFGRWWMPAAASLRAVAGSDRRAVRSVELVFPDAEGARRVMLRRERRRWNAEGATALPVVRMDTAHCVLLPPDAWPQNAWSAGGGEYFTPAKPSPADTQAALRRAVGVLRTNSPRYLQWVDRLLRGVMACEGSANHLRSGSDFNLPGIVQISFPASAAAHAEMLVHECSHLHYQIATRLGEVDDGSDDTLYHSPVKQTGRRIDRILLAYHAFANVMLFYRDCMAAGVHDDGYCERNAEVTRPQLEILDQALRATRALTPLGRALYEPLAEALS